MISSKVIAATPYSHHEVLDDYNHEGLLKYLAKQDISHSEDFCLQLKKNIFLF